MNRIPALYMTLRGQQFRFPSPVGTTDQVKTADYDGIKVEVFWWPAFQVVEVCIAGESTVHHLSSCRVQLADSVASLTEPKRLPPDTGPTVDRQQQTGQLDVGRSNQGHQRSTKR